MARNNIDILVNGEWNGRNEIRKAERDIGGLEKAVDNTGRSTSFLDGAIGGLVGGGLVLLADTLVDAAFAAREYAQESILLAQSAQETTSLLQFSLGPAYDSFIERLDETSEATGRSRAALEEQSSTFIAMTKTAGFAADEAADISASLANIALDLGSFFNQDSDQVFGDLQSALAGSSETLQKYGIDVRDTALRAAALEAGIIEANRPLTQQERILAILSEVQRQAADAMGDAERTADGAANKSRALEDAYADLQREIGERLLPAQDDLVELQLELIQSVGPDLVEIVGEAADTFGALADIIAQFKSGDAAEGSSAIIDFFNFFQKGEISGFFTGALAVANPFAFLAGRLSETARNSTQRVGDELASRQEAIERLSDAYSEGDLSLEGSTEALIKYREEQALATAVTRVYTEDAIAAALARREEAGALRSEQIPAVILHTQKLEQEAEAARVLQEEAEAAAEFFAKVFEARAETGQDFSAFLGEIGLARDAAQELNKSFSLSEVDLGQTTLEDAVRNAGLAAGLSAEKFAILEGALGTYSDEQIAVALEAALLTAEIERIAEAVVNGDLSIEEARGELELFKQELETGRQSRLDMIGDLEEVNTQLSLVEGDRQARVSIQIDGLQDLERAVQLAEQVGAGRVLTQDDPLVQRALAGRTVRQLSPSTTDDANSQGSWR